MSEPKPSETFWNNEPCDVRHVVVKVGKAEKLSFWYAPLEGQNRLCLEVRQHGRSFLMDNEDGSAWHKVTVGRGTMWLGHKSISGEIVNVVKDWR
jgi:hypothetical protein